MKRSVSIAQKDINPVVVSRAHQVEFAIAIQVSRDNAVRASLESTAVRSSIGAAVDEAAGAIAQVNTNLSITGCNICRPYGNVEQVVAVEIAYGDSVVEGITVSETERDRRLERSVSSS